MSLEVGNRVRLNRARPAWRITRADLGANMPHTVLPAGKEGVVVSVDAPEGGPEVCWEICFDDDSRYSYILRESWLDKL